MNIFLYLLSLFLEFVVILILLILLGLAIGIVFGGHRILELIRSDSGVFGTIMRLLCTINKTVIDKGINIANNMIGFFGILLDIQPIVKFCQIYYPRPDKNNKNIVELVHITGANLTRRRNDPDKYCYIPTSAVKLTR